MFLGLVIAIMIISISVLALINSYFLVFSNNYWDLNDYYSSQYASVSAIQKWQLEWTQTWTLTWLGFNDEIWTWERNISWDTINATWNMWNFTNNLQYTIAQSNE